jgi:hypothetical protein
MSATKQNQSSEPKTHLCDNSNRGFTRRARIRIATAMILALLFYIVFVEGQTCSLPSDCIDYAVSCTVTGVVDASCTGAGNARSLLDIHAVVIDFCLCIDLPYCLPDDSCAMSCDDVMNVAIATCPDANCVNSSNCAMGASPSSVTMDSFCLSNYVVSGSFVVKPVARSRSATTACSLVTVPCRWALVIPDLVVLVGNVHRY